MKTEITYLFIVITLLAMCYSLLAPLFPFLASSKNISESTIGIIFSTYALSNIFIIPTINKLIYIIGRRTICYISIFIISFSTLSFGLLSFVESPHVFMLLSSVIMFCEGIGIAILSIMMYSIAASYSDANDIKSNMGYLEFAYSCGLSFGPFLASGLYYFLGETAPFYCVAIITLFVSLSLINKLDIHNEVDESDINFFKLLFHYETLITFGIIMIDMLTTTFFFPVFSTHLNIKFGLRVEITSMFFVFQIIGYFLALQVLNKVNAILGNKLTMMVGLCINLTSVLLLCPVSQFPQTWYTVIIGMTFIGFGGVFITVPGIVDLMTILKDKMHLDEQNANDIASAMYNFAAALGEAFGPMVGGFITEKQGFERACYVTSLVNFIFCVTFGLSNTKHIRRERNEARLRTELPVEMGMKGSQSYLDQSFSSLGVLDRTVMMSKNKYAFNLSRSFSQKQNEGYELLINI